MTSQIDSIATHSMRDNAWTEINCATLRRSARAMAPYWLRRRARDPLLIQVVFQAFSANSAIDCTAKQNRETLGSGSGEGQSNDRQARLSRERAAVLAKAREVIGAVVAAAPMAARAIPGPGSCPAVAGWSRLGAHLAADACGCDD